MSAIHLENFSIMKRFEIKMDLSNEALLNANSFGGYLNNPKITYQQCSLLRFSDGAFLHFQGR